MTAAIPDTPTHTRTHTFTHTHTLEYDACRTVNAALGANAHRLGLSTNGGRAGAVHMMMQLHSLEASMAGDHFDMHTAYLVPGSKCIPLGAPDDGTSVRTVLLWTSFNLALNWYCTHKWYVQERLGVVFGADHTYKFNTDGSAHLTIIMIAPDQSGHRLAFGPVSSEDNATTQYAICIVREHCQEVLRLYSHLKLRI